MSEHRYGDWPTPARDRSPEMEEALQRWLDYRPLTEAQVELVLQDRARLFAEMGIDPNLAWKRKP